MKRGESTTDKLWPIIEPDGDWHPIAWAILNTAALLAVATPFLMALACLSGGLWVANGIQSILLDWLTWSPRFVTTSTYAAKFCMVVFTGRVLWMMVPSIPQLVESARAAIRDET